MARFKPVYKIDKKRLKYPKVCYCTGLFGLLGILSPSRCWFTAWGFNGEEARSTYETATAERVKMRVNNRTATREDWVELYRWERRRARWRDTDEY